MIGIVDVIVEKKPTTFQLGSGCQKNNSRKDGAKSCFFLAGQTEVQVNESQINI